MVDRIKESYKNAKINGAANNKLCIRNHRYVDIYVQVKASDMPVYTNGTLVNDDSDNTVPYSTVQIRTSTDTVILY